MRNHEHYIDKTAHRAIKRTSRSRKRKIRPWGYHLTYRIGEVLIAMNL